MNSDGSRFFLARRSSCLAMRKARLVRFPGKRPLVAAVFVLTSRNWLATSPSGTDGGGPSGHRGGRDRGKYHRSLLAHMTLSENV